MELVLTNEDLAQIDKLIQETPFKYAAPFFQFFQARIQQAQSTKEKSLKVDEIGTIGG